MNSHEIIVIGYPKSGNTWVSRLLGEVLNSPVTGWGVAMPLAKEGAERKGKYTVRQLHLRPLYEERPGGFIASEWQACIPNWDGERVVHVIRDPRDVCVSCMYYWEVDSVRSVIKAMDSGELPFTGVGPYKTFVMAWHREVSVPIYTVRYEDLISNTPFYLDALLHRMQIPAGDCVNTREAVYNQSFEIKRREIESNPSRTEKRPYGMTIQLKNMRKGEVGDWKNHFNNSDSELMQKLFGDTMRELGYGGDDD